MKWEPIEVAIEPETIVKPNEVLVKTKAVSINPIDSFGEDFSGIVIKAGSESGFKESDELYGFIFAPMSAKGSFSEYPLIDPKKIICRSLSGVFYTAFGALRVHESSLKGANVLVLGGGTSVGRYTIQIAKKYMKAAKVVATCSSKSREDDLKYGADVTVHYTGSETSRVN